MTDSAELASARYVNLATFRRNGVEVRTPVWMAGEGRRHYAFSEGAAGKVKRIRANGRARVARCDVRGNVQGEWMDARARIVTDPDTIARAYAQLRRKYGWQLAFADFFSKLSGRYAKRAMLEVELDG